MKSVVFGLALVTSLLPATGWSAADPPNIVLIITDDLGYGDLGCYGATRIRTPHVDRLAAQGLRFTQAYAPASTCTPTRYSVLTGEYPWRQKARATTILDGDAPLAIEPGRVTLPALLRQAGYTTGVVGKWHLGLGDGVTPVDFNAEIKPGPLEIGFDYCHIIPANTAAATGGMGSGANPADPRFAAAIVRETQLFNLAEDPSEKTNLAARHPEKVAELTSQLRRAGALPAAP